MVRAKKNPRVGPGGWSSEERRGESQARSRRRDSAGGDGLGRLARGALAGPRGGHRQERLMLPGAGPGLAGPALEGDVADGRSVLVADHVAPGAGIRGADLGRAAADAEKTLAT